MAGAPQRFTDGAGRATVGADVGALVGISVAAVGVADAARDREGDVEVIAGDGVPLLELVAGGVAEDAALKPATSPMNQTG